MEESKVKKIYWLILSVVWILGACSTNEDEREVQNSSTKVNATEETSTLESIEEDKNYLVYSVKGLEYSVPKGWEEGDSNENTKYHYPENGTLMVSYSETGASIIDDAQRQEFMDGVSGSFDNFELKSESEIIIENTDAYRHEINMELNGDNYKGSIVLFDYLNGIIALMIATLEVSDMNHDNEFEYILNSIKFSDEVESADNASETEIKLGKLITIGDYEVTVQSIEKGFDYEGNDILVINYDFTNNSDDEQMASFAVNFTAYQNGIEVDRLIMSDDVDLGIGQKKIKPGATISGVQTGIMLDDDSLVTIEMDELISFNDLVFTIEVDPVNVK